MTQLAIIGGIWISLLYSATVMPATVWVIQLTVSRGWMSGIAAAAGLTLGQLPWAGVTSLLLFQNPAFWQRADPFVRGIMVVFLVWFAWRSARAPRLRALRLIVQGSTWALFRSSAWKSMVMPWRFFIWSGIIVAISIHLRGPGWEAAGFFTIGAAAGLVAWLLHFVILAGLFGNSVPDDITLHSMNKLRLLATIVPAGLVLVILAPVVID